MLDALKTLLDWLRSPGEGLGQRVLHSGVWATALNVGDRGVTILRLVVLARLLSPADLGLFGIALLAVTALRQVGNLGIEPAVVQREEENVDAYLDTAWVIAIARGVVSVGCLYVAAPFVAGFFGEPRVTPLLRVLGATVLLGGFRNPGVIYFQKDLEFHRQFAYQLSGTLVNAVVAIVAALLLHDVWALVFGIVAGRATDVLASYLLHDYRPNLSFDRERASELIAFGKWMWGVGVVTFLATSGDDAFVGWFLASAALGYYQVAFRLSNAPATEVSHVVSNVVFPAYAKLQDDTQALRDAFLRTIRLVFVVTVPMSVGIVVVAHGFTAVVLGDRWLPIVPVLQVMAVAGLLRAVSVTGGALFKGSGEPEWSFWMNVARVVVIAVTIWPLTARFGIVGAGASITLGIAATLPVWAYRSAVITGLEWRDYFVSIAIPTVGSALMAILVSLVPTGSALGLVLSVAVGAVSYPAFVYPLYRVRGVDPVAEFLSLAR